MESAAAWSGRGGSWSDATTATPMNPKLTGLLVLVLAVSGLSSCSFFDGKKKKHTNHLSESTLLPVEAPALGSGGPNLGTSQSRR